MLLAVLRLLFSTQVAFNRLRGVRCCTHGAFQPQDVRHLTVSFSIGDLDPGCPVSMALGVYRRASRTREYFINGRVRRTAVRSAPSENLLRLFELRVVIASYCRPCLVARNGKPDRVSVLSA
ncbi:hypothetical protein GY45DRAFT_195371 [Cubamyces sp. BRFM 1775]|nr:hypothetical protein GY45DRAFT_195371 [Cubamyces sp. BRFM 1775]